MATPLSATGRILTPYTINGITHVLHVYVRNPQVVGATYNINTRTTDSNDLAFGDAVTALGAWLSKIWASGVTFGSSLLQLRSGTVFNTVAAATFVPALAGGVPYSCGQVSIVFRDKLFARFRIQIMEAGFTPPYHKSGYPTGDAGTDALIKEFTPDFTITNAPYNWVVGRGDQYLNTSPFIGFTATLNRRIRRARGLA